MSDDLVKRLREESFEHSPEYNIFDEAADRIENLEATLREIMNMGQRAVPNHWEACCLFRDIARNALEGKDD